MTESQLVTLEETAIPVESEIFTGVKYIIDRKRKGPFGCTWQAYTSHSCGLYPGFCQGTAGGLGSI
jgi:hypothetical protein